MSLRDPSVTSLSLMYDQSSGIHVVSSVDYSALLISSDILCPIAYYDLVSTSYTPIVAPYLITLDILKNIEVETTSFYTLTVFLEVKTSTFGAIFYLPVEVEVVALPVIPVIIAPPVVVDVIVPFPEIIEIVPEVIEVIVPPAVVEEIVSPAAIKKPVPNDEFLAELEKFLNQTNEVTLIVNET